MANTSNIGLSKLDGTEKLKTFPITFNSDMDTIDTVVGNDVGTSRTISQAITRTEEGIAIVANGNTHSAISSGQYVYVKNHGSLAEGLYITSSAISANATLSGSNLTAVSGGGLNSVYSALNSKISKFRQINIVGQTDSGGNRLVQTGYINIISVYFAGYICYPFYLNGNTYIKVLNFGTLEPATNISIDAVATIIDSGLF